MALATLYYVAGLWEIPGAADAFFSESNSWLLGMVLWFASSLLLALPWGLLRPYGAKGMIGALILTILPPLGIIGWLNPLLAAADLFPGWGFVGLALTAVACLAPAHKRGWQFLTVAAALGVVAHLTFTPRQLPSSWLAVNTDLGKYPETVVEQAYWQTRLTNIAKAGIQTGAEVVLLPEQVGGWQTKAMQQLWALELRYSGAKPNQMILIGGAQPLDERRYANALFVWMNDDMLGTVSSRQTVPVSMWRPYSRTGTHAPINWFKTNVLQVPLHGMPVKTIAVFCYEETLMFPMLTSLAFESPYAIISVVNGWWASPAEQKVQTQHIDAWAKLFNLPVLRAVNRRAA